MAGMCELYPDKAEKFRFIEAGNGEIHRRRSGLRTGNASAKNGIEPVDKNAADARSWT